MKLLEKILAVLIIVGIAMKFNQLQGSSFLLVLSIGLLADLYYLLGFALFNDIPLKKIFKRDSYSRISTKRIVGSVGAGFAIATLLVGILFKIQHYPGANLMLYAGLFFLIIVFVVSLFKYLKNTSEFYINILKRAIIIGGFGILLVLMPKYSLEKIQYRNYPEYIEAVNYYIDHKDDGDAYRNMRLELYNIVYPEADSNDYGITNKERVDREMEWRKH